MRKRSILITHIHLLVALLFIVLACGLFFLTKKLKQAESVILNNEVRSDVVRMRLYEGTLSTEFEGPQTLSYSFRVPEGASIVTALQGKALAVTQNNKVLARVSFSYEGGRGFTEEEYIREVIFKDESSKEVPSIQSVNDKSFFIVNKDDARYYVSRVQNGNWIVVFQGEGGEESVKHIAATFSVR